MLSLKLNSPKYTMFIVILLNSTMNEDISITIFILQVSIAALAVLEKTRKLDILDHTQDMQGKVPIDISIQRKEYVRPRPCHTQEGERDMVEPRCSHSRETSDMTIIRIFPVVVFGLYDTIPQAPILTGSPAHSCGKH